MIIYVSRFSTEWKRNVAVHDQTNKQTKTLRKHASTHTHTRAHTHHPPAHPSPRSSYRVECTGGRLDNQPGDVVDAAATHGGQREAARNLLAVKHGVLLGQVGPGAFRHSAFVVLV